MSEEREGSCERGHFHNVTSQACLPCPKGEFQNEPSRISCTLCPEGTTTGREGAQDQDDCFEICDAGFFFDRSSSKCEPCGLRGYQPKRGSDHCIPCPPSTVPFHLNTTSLEQCLEKCSPGSQRSDEQRCEMCPLGSFKGEDDAVCMLCPTGFTSVNKGTRSLEECNIRLCFPGAYFNSASGDCKACERGLYSDAYDSRICKKCPINTTTYKTGANTVVQCQHTNQCKAGTHSCHWLAACFDLPDEIDKPMFSCKCKPGYVGNGFHCTDACEGLCLHGGTCLKTGRGETRCICQKGFTGRRCDVQI